MEEANCAPGRPVEEAGRLARSTSVHGCAQVGAVDRGRSTAPTCAHRARRSTGPVDRPPPPVDRDIDREHKLPAPCAVPRFFVIRSLCYLLPSPPSPLSPLSQHVVYCFYCAIILLLRLNVELNSYYPSLRIYI